MSKVIAVDQQASRLRRLTWVLFGVAVAISLSIAEATCRILLPTPGFEPFGPHAKGLVIPHSTRSFAYRPNFSTSVGVGQRQITVSFNALGLRDDPVSPDDTTERRILAVGNSFTTGFGVEAAEAWPKQLEQRLNVRLPASGSFRVINAGISGYSLEQIRDLTQELVPLLRPKLVVVGVYLRGYHRVNDPFVLLHGGTIQRSRIPDVVAVEGGILISPFHRPWLRRLDFWLDRHFHFGALLLKAARRGWSRLGGSSSPVTPPPLTVERANVLLQPLLGELGRMQDLTRRWGIPLVALLVDEQEEKGGYRPSQDLLNEAATAFARSQGIPVVDPLPSFKQRARGNPIFRLTGDFHWSPFAHQLAAEALATRLLADGLLTQSGRAARR